MPYNARPNLVTGYGDDPFRANVADEVYRRREHCGGCNDLLNDCCSDTCRRECELCNPLSAADNNNTGEEYILAHEHETRIDERREYNMPRAMNLPWSRSFGIEIETLNGSWDGCNDLADDLAERLSFLTNRIVRNDGEDSSVIMLSNGWGVCYDGSCGFEVKSPILSGTAGLESVAMMMRAMRDIGCEVNSSCGIHIHVDTRDFRNDAEKVGNLAAMVSRTEDIIFAFVNRSRSGNTYCRTFNIDVLNGIRSAETIEQLMVRWYGYSGMRNDEALRYVYNDRTQHYHHSRYQAANLHSIFYRGSVEMRYFNSTVANSDLVKAWITFCVATVEYAARARRIKISRGIVNRYGGTSLPKRFARIIKTFANGSVLGAFPEGAAEILSARMSARIGREVINPIAATVAIASE